jgi:hypothetical protein
MLHLGLAAILIAAKVKLSNDQYGPSWNVVLAKERQRKQVARRKEEESQQFLLIKISDYVNRAALGPRDMFDV